MSNEKKFHLYHVTLNDSPARMNSEETRAYRRLTYRLNGSGKFYGFTPTAHTRTWAIYAMDFEAVRGQILKVCDLADCHGMVFDVAKVKQLRDVVAL